MTATDRPPLRIGGVPEHFNLPWHLALEARPVAAAEWRDYSTGTGAMLADLAAGRLDLAPLLTEGAALGLARGLPVKVVSLYTTSPLIWGVHVPADSRWHSVDELRGLRFAISRPGSGSHLMSLALALDRGWPVGGQPHVVVDDLPGAVQAFSQRRADVFLWEHFTTQPTVDAGVFRRIGDFPSPWPAWVIAVNAEVWKQDRRRIESLMAQVMAAARDLVSAPDAPARIAARYGLAEAAVSEWLAGTAWVTAPVAPDSALASARRMLEAAGVVEPSASKQHRDQKDDVPESQQF